MFVLIKDILAKEVKNFNKDLLEIIDLSVEYRTLEGIVYAVKGVNLTLKKGENLGLVGETGAGKTTTSMAVLSLLPKQGIVTRGKIFFNGQNILEMGGKQLSHLRGNKISMIFQDPMSSLNPVFSVAFQIAETIKIHNKITWREAYHRANKMLNSVGISSDRAKEFPHEFSGGMIQRVMIAIALACEPSLLIADEPTTALDVTIQAQILELLKGLKEQFKTSMIFITHDLGIVPNICSTVAVMYSGRIVEYGCLSDIYKRSAHPYTKALFNCIPDVDNPNKQLNPIKGSSPNPKYHSVGCPYQPRCSDCKNICKVKMPVLTKIKDNHQVACFKYNNVF